MLQLPTSTNRNRASLVNWVENTGSICRQEANLLYESDLCASLGLNDLGLTAVETFVERVLQACQKGMFLPRHRI